MLEMAAAVETKSQELRLPITSADIDRLWPQGIKAFPAFLEVAKRHPAEMAIVLPVLDFFSHSYGPQLLQAAKLEREKGVLVPQIKLENEEGRLQALREGVQNICMLNLTDSIKRSAERTNWQVLAQCLPLADYPTAVYLKHVINSTIDDLTYKVLHKAWRELTTESLEECRGALWEIFCPHIPYWRVGSPAESDLDWPPPLARPDCPSFSSEECRREHTDAHLKEFLEIEKKVEIFLTPREKETLTEQQERGREFGFPPEDPFWEDIDYQAIAWSAFSQGLEIPLDLFQDPKVTKDPARRNAARFLYLFDPPGVKKPILVVAVYPNGREKWIPVPDGGEQIMANIISCYPLDNPRGFYHLKVQGKSTWSYLKFAQELWTHSVRRWTESPETSLSPRKIQQRYLSVRRVYEPPSPAR